MGTFFWCLVTIVTIVCVCVFGTIESLAFFLDDLGSFFFFLMLDDSFFPCACIIYYHYCYHFCSRKKFVLSFHIWWWCGYLLYCPLCSTMDNDSSSGKAFFPFRKFVIVCWCPALSFIWKMDKFHFCRLENSVWWRLCNHILTKHVLRMPIFECPKYKFSLGFCSEFCRVRKCEKKFLLSLFTFLLSC